MNSSSQSFAPVSRLLWKEYRAQRAFWLTMLFLGWAAQFLSRIVTGDPASRIGAVWTWVPAMPVLFVIGSMAILFAGEREERTTDWLRHLAVSPLWTLVAKWSFVLIASLSLAVLLSTTAILLVWSLPAPPEVLFLGSTSNGPSRDMPLVVGILWVFAGFFLWGSLGSLLSRRVVTSVPAMGFWWIMTLVVPVIWTPMLLGINYVHPLHQRISEILLVLSFVVVGVADIWLGWRWCQGKYLDAQVLDDLNLNVSDWVGRLRGRLQQTSRVSVGVEFENRWRREWQRLVWQERHREYYHSMLLYVGCALGVMLALMSRVYGHHLADGLLPVVVAMPLAMGLFGFRYDGEGQPLRFLANHGISSRIVWLAKHAVWLPRAFWIPVVIWGVGCIAELLLRHDNLNMQRPSLYAISAATWPHVAAMLWFVSLSYGIGQISAMLFRRVILAVAVGVFLNVIGGFWLAAMATLDVPLWWSVGSLVIWMFAFTWWTAPRWMMGRRDVRGALRLAAGLVLPLVLVGVVGTWRAREIIGFGPSSPFMFALMHPFEYFRLSPEIEKRIAATAELKAESQRQSIPITAEDQQMLDSLALTLGGFDTVRDFELQGGPNALPADMAGPEREQAARERFWSSNESRLSQILEIAQHRRGVSASRWLDLGAANLLPHLRLLSEAGRLRTKEGRLSDAFQYYCAGLRLASFWATGKGLSWVESAEFQRLFMMQNIVEWANHPDQTGATLRSAVRRIQSEFELFPSVRETLVAQYLDEQRGLEDVIQFGRPRSSNPRDVRNSAWQVAVAEGSRSIPWERSRACRFLEQVLYQRDREAAIVAFWLNQPGIDVPRLIETDLATASEITDERRLLATTPLVLESRLELFTASWLIVERETFIRESVLALSLLAWKHDHQQWPDSLGDLLSAEGLSPITVVDPWSGAQFTYNGSLLNRVNGVQSELLLTSQGQAQLRDVYVVQSPSPDGASRSEPKLATSDWRGQRRESIHDGRLQLQVVEGRLVLQRSNAKRTTP